MAGENLSVANLDFSSIKTSLKGYLKQQNIFKDFDFEGSNLSAMLDVLSYNTYMQNFYLNMVASESFLDSAQLRDSVVSHAKQLNYLPRSRRSSKATVLINITPDDVPPTITIPKYTEFTTVVDSNTYTFTTNDVTIVSQNANGNYLTANVSLFEGTIQTELFEVDTSNTSQRFVISNKNIDTDSLVVKIVNSSSDTANTVWQRSLNIVGITPTSNVYFVTPAEREKYEIQFGDGVLGRALTDGNIVEATYRVSSGNTADGATTFSLSGDIAGYSNVDIILVSKAQGGDDAESIKSIKFNAPKSATVQDRTVTKDDYTSLIIQQFPDVQSISVYGGEEVDPPQFGKVIISVDLQDADGISLQRKNDIINFVKRRSPLSIVPSVVDPEFLYVKIETNAIYDPTLTTKSDNQIKEIVTSTINTFAQTNINKFNTKLRLSKLTSAIDAADESILNNETFVTLQKRFVPTLGQTQSWSLKFNNPIYREVPVNGAFVDGSAPLSSTTFVYGDNSGCSLRDNGFGIVQVVIATTTDSQTVQVINPNVGTINYDEGIVQINDFAVASFSGSGIFVNCKPTKRTFSATKNIILQHDGAPTITVNQERT